MEQEINEGHDGLNIQTNGGVESKQVSYESYLKAVEEEKNARKRAQDSESRAQELQSRLQEFQRKEMEAKGEYEKLNQSLVQEVESLTQALKKKDAAFFDAMVKSSVKTEAVKAGCSNPDKLIKLLSKEDYEILQADADGYSFKRESLQSLIDKAKKENDFLFKKPEVKVNDLSPKSKVETQKTKSVNDMTKEELEQAILALNKNRR